MKKTNTSSGRPVRVLDGLPMLIVIIIVVAFLYIGGISGLFSSNTQRYLLKIVLYITMGSMWNLMSGFTGMTSLGQQTFIGLAGYSLAIMTTIFKLPFGVGLLVGALVGLGVSFGLSFILFRMRGMYFAIATWVVAEAFCTWFLSWKFAGQGGGMTISIKNYPRVSEIYLMGLTLCVVALIVIYALLRTKTGLGLTAMRDDADAASSVGVNIFKSKLLCYVICCVFIALAGGLFFLNKGAILPGSGFSIDWTVAMVFIVIIGGVGTMSGPIVGAIIYVLLEEQLAAFPGWSNIILGIIAILVILFLPDGIMGTLQKKLNFEIFSQKRFSEPKKLGLKKKKVAE